MRNNTREEVNSIVREYKRKNLSESDAIERISKKMHPLYIKTKRRMVPFDMSIHPNGDLYNVYLETIQYSLKSFKFAPHGMTKEVYSFIPYFTNMFSNRSKTYMKDLSQRLYESNRNISIEDKFNQNQNEDVVPFEVPEQLKVSLEGQIDFSKKLFSHLHSTLSPEEWYIFDHRIRDFSFQSISVHMKRDKVPFACSHQNIYLKWNRIRDKIKFIIKGWKDASNN